MWAEIFLNTRITGISKSDLFPIIDTYIFERIKVNCGTKWDFTTTDWFTDSYSVYLKLIWVEVMILYKVGTIFWPDVNIVPISFLQSGTRVQHRWLIYSKLQRLLKAFV